MQVNVCEGVCQKCQFVHFSSQSHHVVVFYVHKFNFNLKSHTHTPDQLQEIAWLTKPSVKCDNSQYEWAACGQSRGPIVWVQSVYGGWLALTHTPHTYALKQSLPSRHTQTHTQQKAVQLWGYPYQSLVCFMFTMPELWDWGQWSGSPRGAWAMEHWTHYCD